MATGNNNNGGGEIAAVLRKSWYGLRLSVRDPSRVPTWDAIVLTAASPEQAQLYDWHLRRARRMGRIAPRTVTLAVPDPDGARIGSGAATLYAVAALARRLLALGQVSNDTSGDLPASDNGSLTNDTPSLSMVDYLAKMHILLLHAGGDSKRVPWANPMGKVFLPLPYLAMDNPDGPVPLLFDHILAISSGARQAFKNKGGILIMTGDVLPSFDATTLVLPDDACCIITVPITLDIASNHGVIVASKDGVITENYSLCLVDNLLQKPTMIELMESQAIQHDGRALLDTGIIAVRGKAWLNLVALAYSSSQRMIMELLESRNEVRLAHQVLQKVVTRYLRRDNLLIASIKRLAALARLGREVLMNGDLDELGQIMLEAWRLHQELDPFCSNVLVDKLFALADPYCCGYKLVGAGGGGFALLLARDRYRALELRRALEEAPDLDVKVYNWNIFLG